MYDYQRGDYEHRLTLTRNSYDHASVNSMYSNGKFINYFRFFWEMLRFLVVLPVHFVCAM